MREAEPLVAGRRRRGRSAAWAGFACVTACAAVGLALRGEARARGAAPSLEQQQRQEPGARASGAGGGGAAAEANATAAAAARNASRGAALARPNIFLVTLDDVGHNDFGYQSSDLGAATPHITRSPRAACGSRGTTASPRARRAARRCSRPSGCTGWASRTSR